MFLLRELLKQTDMQVYCLIREENEEKAREKLHKSCLYYKIEEISFDRVKIIVGDLNKENFGLSDKQFDDLAQQVDVIYHNGT